MKNIYKAIKDHNQIKSRPYIAQFIKFAIIGTVNTFVDFGIYFGLTRSSIFWEKHYLWANFIAFVVAASSSYIFNKNWTFRDTNKKIRIQYSKFILVSAIGLTINETILFFLVTKAGLHDLMAKVLAIGVVLFWNFTINKLWTFRPEKQQPDSEL